MPKIKKTKKQKIQSNARKESQVDRQQEDRAAMSPTYSLQGISLETPAKRVSTAQATTIAIKTNEYHYLSADLRKTIVLTLSIAVVELLLYFFFFRGA